MSGIKGIFRQSSALSRSSTSTPETPQHHQQQQQQAANTTSTPATTPQSSNAGAGAGAGTGAGAGVGSTTPSSASRIGVLTKTPSSQFDLSEMEERRSVAGVDTQSIISSPEKRPRATLQAMLVEQRALLESKKEELRAAIEEETMLKAKRRELRANEETETQSQYASDSEDDTKSIDNLSRENTLSVTHNSDELPPPPQQQTPQQTPQQHSISEHFGFEPPPPTQPLPHSTSSDLTTPTPPTITPSTPTPSTTTAAAAAAATTPSTRTSSIGGKSISSTLSGVPEQQQQQPPPSTPRQQSMSSVVSSTSSRRLTDSTRPSSNPNKRTITVTRKTPDEPLGFELRSIPVPIGPIRDGFDRDQLRYATFVDGLSQDSLSYRSGLRKGDQVLEVDGEPCENSKDEAIIRLILRNRGTIVLTVRTSADYARAIQFEKYIANLQLLKQKKEELRKYKEEEQELENYCRQFVYLASERRKLAQTLDLCTASLLNIPFLCEDVGLLITLMQEQWAAERRDGFAMSRPAPAAPSESESESDNNDDDQPQIQSTVV